VTAGGPSWGTNLVMPRGGAGCSPTRSLSLSRSRSLSRCPLRIGLWAAGTGAGAGRANGRWRGPSCTRLPISDSALYVATLAKRPALAAYEIAKPQAPHDTVHGKKLNAAINLYGNIAKAGAATKKAKQK